MFLRIVAIVSGFVLTAVAQQIPADREHTAWISASLRSIETIKAGMVRRDLETIFTTEGGISTRQRRAYVFRECRYIKVDVEFEAVDGGDSVSAESPLDKIVNISRPYLQWSHMD